MCSSLLYPFLVSGCCCCCVLVGGNRPKSTVAIVRAQSGTPAHPNRRNTGTNIPSNNMRSRGWPCVLLMACMLVMPVCLFAASSSVSVGSASVEFDPDEVEGIPEQGGEVLLDDEHTTEPSADAPSSIWSDASDSAATPGSVIPDSAFDADRVAKSLDWVHIHYAVSVCEESSSAAADSCRLLSTSRKLGRSPWIVQLSTGAGIGDIEKAISGMKIGEKRKVDIVWSQEYAELGPQLIGATISDINDGDRLSYTFELMRFDVDIKELTFEDKFWNNLPMLAFFAFIGMRIMRAPPGEMQPEAEQQKGTGKTQAGAGKKKR